MCRECGTCEFSCVVLRRQRLLCEMFMLYVGAHGKQCARYQRRDDRQERLPFLREVRAS